MLFSTTLTLSARHCVKKARMMTLTCGPDSSKHIDSNKSHICLYKLVQDSSRTRHHTSIHPVSLLSTLTPVRTHTTTPRNHWSDPGHHRTNRHADSLEPQDVSATLLDVALAAVLPWHVALAVQNDVWMVLVYVSLSDALVNSPLLRCAQHCICSFLPTQCMHA